MQPVLGLVEHDRMRAVHDLVGDFFTAVGGQAMHEKRIGLSQRHQPVVDLITFEQVVAAGAVAVSHRDPGVGDDAIGVL